MSHISAITAAMFTDLALCTTPVLGDVTMEDIEREAGIGNKLDYFDAGFATENKAGSTLAIDKAALLAPIDVASTQALFNNFVRITNVKEFPAIGTPANITKVPEYGSKTSKQVNGQADLNNMELTLNYVARDWAGGVIHKGDGTGAALTADVAPVPAVGDGKVYLFRFALLDTDPTKATTTGTKGYHNGDDNLAGTGDSEGLAAIGNSIYYFLGKIEAIEVTPSLTDAVTAKLTIAIQSKISGAWTQGA